MEAFVTEPLQALGCNKGTYPSTQQRNRDQFLSDCSTNGTYSSVQCSHLAAFLELFIGNCPGALTICQLRDRECQRNACGRRASRNACKVSDAVNRKATDTALCGCFCRIYANVFPVIHRKFVDFLALFALAVNTNRQLESTRNKSGLRGSFSCLLQGRCCFLLCLFSLFIAALIRTLLLVVGSLVQLVGFLIQRFHDFATLDCCIIYIARPNNIKERMPCLFFDLAYLFFNGSDGFCAQAIGIPRQHLFNLFILIFRDNIIAAILTKVDVLIFFKMLKHMA
jgi:hypothetical protein